MISLRVGSFPGYLDNEEVVVVELVYYVVSALNSYSKHK